MLLCAVRSCHLPLAREGRRFVCPKGHSFDIARSDYINLLQPQDRRSKDPGDSAAAVAARRRLHDRGVTAPLLEAISVSPDDVVLDIGCGDGFHLGSLTSKGHGIDISIPAVEAAAKRYPDCEWVVANADRFIPYSDATFSVVMSITARMNPAEFKRVLHPDGRLFVAIPAPDDLIELRGQGRDRSERTIEEFKSLFELVDQRRVTTVDDLDREGVEDVLLSIYRPMQPKPAEAGRVTFSLDLLTFRVSF
jgi:23S rRNA (guanine745-N1)-methyltransferase